MENAAYFLEVHWLAGTAHADSLAIRAVYAAARRLPLEMGMHTTLIDLVKDPTLIPHVYDYCDHWCEGCHVSAHCLAYRTSDLWPAGSWGDDPEQRAAEGLAWARAVSDATGTSVAALDVELSDPAFIPPEGVLGHRLERLGRQYMLLVSMYLPTIGGAEWARAAEVERSPIAVLSRLHLTIASKIFRALVSEHRANRGEPSLMSDANATAKLVLVAIEQSREALSALQTVDPADHRLAGLDDYLALLAIAVGKQFPDARTFVRPGLDETMG